MSLTNDPASTEPDPNAENPLARRWNGKALYGTALVGLGILLFLTIARQVGAGNTSEFDDWALMTLRNPDDLSDPVGPHWFETMARDATALGGVGFLTLLTLLVIIYLMLRRRYRLAWFVAAAIGLGITFSTLLKSLYDRPRPALVPHETLVASSSFPSGHSMMSAVCFLTLGAILASMRSERALKAFFLGVAVFLVVSVGLSRIYLGVHYPTDVLAGWIAGAVWATFSVGLARYFHLNAQDAQLASRRQNK